MPTRVALVTGCSQSGSLGVTVAILLQRTGRFRVFATARDLRSPGILEALASGCQLDVTDPRSISTVVSGLEQHTGNRLNVLVNNAAVWERRTILDYPIGDLRGVYETNFIGPVAVIQGLAPLMITTAIKSNKRPLIVNVGSQAANGVPWQMGYSTSKAAFNLMSDILRIEVKGLGIEVMTLVPGSFTTSGTANTTRTVLPPSRAYSTKAKLSAHINWRFTELNRDLPSVEAVAHDIVKLIGRGRGGKVYLAAGAFMSQYVLGWLPHTAIDKIMGSMFGMDLVEPPSEADLAAQKEWSASDIE